MKKEKRFIASEIELRYRSKVPMKDRPQVLSSENSYQILLNHWSEDIEFREEFNILLLNKSFRVLGFLNISKGGIAQTAVDARIIFAAALKANAVSILLAHNHPSQNIQPSQPDIELTKKLIKAGKLLNIHIIDHLIITPFEYFSFADEGLLASEIASIDTTSDLPY